MSDLQKIEFSSNAELTVDRKGGKWKSGIIRNFAVLTTGVEALGHGLYVDEAFGQEVAEALQTKYGIKSRLTHVQGDGIASGLGRVFYSKTEGGKVYGDLHFWASAHKSPTGNLADFVMTKAEEDPQAFGSSIGFARDISREEWNDDLPRVRLAELKYVDIVDSPATNPEGLFSSTEDKQAALAKLLEKLTLEDIDFMRVNLINQKADLGKTPFNKDLPEQEEAEDVVQDAPEAPQEEIANEEAPSEADEKAPEAPAEEPEAEDKVEEAPAEEAPEPDAPADEPAAEEVPSEEEEPAEEAPAEEAPAEEPVADPEPVAVPPQEEPAEPQPTPEELQAKMQQELTQYTELFGAQEGQDMYFAGVSMEDAQSQFIAKQAAEIKALKNKLDVEMSSSDPVGQSGPVRSAKGFASLINTK